MDNITITCVRPSLDQTIVVTVPEPMVQMLDWLAANIKNPDGTNKYLYGLNVLWKDAIDLLVPLWGQQFTAGQIAAYQAQIDAARQEISTSLAAGIDQLTVVGP